MPPRDWSSLQRRGALRATCTAGCARAKILGRTISLVVDGRKLPVLALADSYARLTAEARALSAWRQHELRSHVAALDVQRVQHAAERRAWTRWIRAMRCQQVEYARTLGRTIVTLARALRAWRARLATRPHQFVREARVSIGMMAIGFCRWQRRVWTARHRSSGPGVLSKGAEAGHRGAFRPRGMVNLSTPAAALWRPTGNLSMGGARARAVRHHIDATMWRAMRRWQLQRIDGILLRSAKWHWVEDQLAGVLHGWSAWVAAREHGRRCWLIAGATAAMHCRQRVVNRLCVHARTESLRSLAATVGTRSQLRFCTHAMRRWQAACGHETLPVLAHVQRCHELARALILIHSWRAWSEASNQHREAELLRCALPVLQALRRWQARAEGRRRASTLRVDIARRSRRFRLPSAWRQWRAQLVAWRYAVEERILGGRAARAVSLRRAMRALRRAVLWRLEVHSVRMSCRHRAMAAALGRLRQRAIELMEARELLEGTFLVSGEGTPRTQIVRSTREHSGSTSLNASAPPAVRIQTSAFVSSSAATDTTRAHRAMKQWRAAHHTRRVCLDVKACAEDAHAIRVLRKRFYSWKLTARLTSAVESRLQSARRAAAVAHMRRWRHECTIAPSRLVSTLASRHAAWALGCARGARCIMQRALKRWLMTSTHSAKVELWAARHAKRRLTSALVHFYGGCRSSNHAAWLDATATAWARRKRLTTAARKLQHAAQRRTASVFLCSLGSSLGRSGGSLFGLLEDTPGSALGTTPSSRGSYGGCLPHGGYAPLAAPSVQGSHIRSVVSSDPASRIGSIASSRPAARPPLRPTGSMPSISARRSGLPPVAPSPSLLSPTLTPTPSLFPCTPGTRPPLASLPASSTARRGTSALGVSPSPVWLKQVWQRAV